MNGKVRKYYTLTAQGHDMLREARRNIAELTREVLEEHPPPARPKEDM